ncbi:Roundabout 1 [Dermatophagoides pteronyssinus]|uniref:Roundabout 1 n=1 Tax=Dermatophagoides pteronyssinus TaxID=6956 RepID=A0ABQ8JWA6_DERPT|nr:Roundabout 1 [Dermatophagoides pteronyssinus]
MNFSIMLMNTQFCQGKQLYYKCSLPKGRPELIVYWLHDGKPIDLNQRSIDDQGQYQCIAKKYDSGDLAIDKSQYWKIKATKN